MGNDQKTRYKLIKQVGAGDYAKVYAAEDVKLGRKVAIKQLHSQYMDDEVKLERYWAEAKLLLELEHPNIMTIYDVVKSRGRLVLELMQGSLKQIYGKKPMPIPDVRQTIKQAARGLGCLHENGIIHGDIKPANLMLSRTNVVKLGDFGLARRASDDEGSMVKGTTKYMAPELVSEEFGPVGPASDLYSLGFSALELMVGPDFDSLFPDLVAFGRDKQMAWMMWHCSADRRLPVKSVLEGVPEEIANVIEKLTTKDQAKRYRSADEVVADLSGHAKPVGVSLKEEEAAEAMVAKKQKLKKRIYAATSCVISLVICATILFWPEPVEPVARTAPPPVKGVIKNVLPFDDKFVIDIGGSWEEYELIESDTVNLNRKKRQLRDLEVGDRVVVNTHIQAEGPDRFEIIAFRPEHHTGIISEIKTPNNQIVVTVNDDSDDAGAVFELLVEDATSISVNEQMGTEENPLRLIDLQKNDSIVVDLADDIEGMVAIKIDAIRQVELSGVIRKLSPQKGTMTIAKTEGGTETLVTLKLDSSCTFSLNGAKSLKERLLTASDIQIGDRVALMHDVKIKSIEAYRPFEDKGIIRSVAYDNGTFVLKSQSATQAKSYTIGPKTQVLLGGEQARVDELRAGDEAQLVHDSPDDNSPTLLSLNVDRPQDKNKWAILIANQEFDSASLSPWSGSVKNVGVLKKQLTKRFGVREDQVKVFENESLVTLEQELGGILGGLESRDELYVYYATRSFVEKGKAAYLATKEFTVDDMPRSGMELGWLIDTLDACSCGKKVLFLDCPSDSSKEDGPATAAELVQLLQETKRGGYPKFTYVMANAQPGDQVSVLSNGTEQTAFGTALAEAFAGKADREKDAKVEITEISNYITERTVKLAKLSNKAQSPILFIPDNRPPRLSDEVKADIITLLSTFSQPKIDSELVVNTGNQISSASAGQPEPMLAVGIILVKAFKMDEALEVFDQTRLQHPSRLLAHQGVTWIHLYKRRYDRATETLAEMLDQIPVPEEGEVYSPTVLKKFAWIGSVRELSGSSMEWVEDKIPDATVLARCDELVARHSKAAQAAYQSGRVPIREKINELTASLESDPSANADLLRNRVKTYNIPVATEESIQEIRDGLDLD